MTRGVKLGTKRGCYKRFNKSKLRRLARAIREGNLDHEEIAQAFESTGRLPDRIIAGHLRQGRSFNLQRLASAVETLSAAYKPPRPQKPLSLRFAKAALKHLSPEYGGKGMPVHTALRVQYPYVEDKNVRAYHRLLEKDYGPRSTYAVNKQLDRLWPQRKLGCYPQMEQAIRDCASGNGVPREVIRSVIRKRYLQRP